MASEKIKLSKWEDKRTCDFLDHNELIRYYVKRNEKNIVSYIKQSKGFSWKAAIFDVSLGNSPLFLYDDNLDVLKLKVDILLSQYGYLISKLGF